MILSGMMMKTENTFWKLIANVICMLFLICDTLLPVSVAVADSCPALDSNVETQLGRDFPQIIQEIRSHLEQGGSAIEIPATFRRKSEDFVQRIDVGVVIADLTGTGKRDFVVTISRGDGWSVGSSGVFVFRSCGYGRYGVHYISPDPSSNLRLDYAYVSVISVRLRGDGTTQLLVRYGSVASGRCKWELYMVVGLVKDSWTTYLSEEVGCGSRDVTYVTKVIARDPDMTGRKGLVLMGDRWDGWGVYQFAVRRVRVFYSWHGDELRFEKKGISRLDVSLSSSGRCPDCA